ncbi:hypothetical protein SPRG_22237 [Saprolegnia parasitica CBS 223.65]|uniref:Uncharacterized protein n=1 Tax=Saprolegnia parasitica (strain CBS 223.65) TaxID=695850 RepID=A0A067C7T1_SAPPC|nr:hypothetical protein SPRG_22237 [Saprolegnia parasitica CBS 223.65]KDO25180.1 hypothetical protein SPRG_22237 [Saprolegnia parasitica CBS 223.65]|eukprot:XP_012204123.1 hypothetical protein SPRG_22237 [Saprolegnia parasitica CBS 223.65]
MAATVVVEAPQSDKEDADENDGHLSSETSEDEEDEQDDVALDDDEDEASPADDIDMEAATERELELACAQAPAASSSSSETDSEDNDEDVDMEAEIVKELEAATVEMTPAAPVVAEAARKEAANARRLAGIKEREAQMAAMKKQPTPIATTNKTITFGDDSDDSRPRRRRHRPRSARSLATRTTTTMTTRATMISLGSSGARRKRSSSSDPSLPARTASGSSMCKNGLAATSLFTSPRASSKATSSTTALTTLRTTSMNNAIQTWATAAPDADEVAKQAYITETELSLARLHRSVSDAKDFKQLGWLAAVRRYDPLDAGVKAFEQTAPTDAEIAKDNDDDDDGEPLPPMPVRKETPMPEVSEERYFAATSDLSTMFSRVRANSEDGEEMEAALDGIVKPAAAASSGFSFASMFGGGDVIEDDVDDHVDAKPLEEKPDLDDSTWHFANTVRKVVQDDSTDDEAMEDDDDDVECRHVGKPDPWTKTHEADWMTLRKT